MLYLSKEQIDFFYENGYLLIEDFWNEETVNQIVDRIHHLVRNANLTGVKSVFTTNEQTRKMDDYFLESGDKISFFWEEKAWTSEGNLSKEPEVAINKVGHALHDLDPLFEQISYDGRVGSICAELGMEKPLIAQSMYIFKQAFIGGEVCPHQDGTFLYTEPQSCIGFWWPLNDCTTQNGCLWAVPGSQKLGVHRRYRRRDPPFTSDNEDRTEFVPKEKEVWSLEGAVPLEIKKGTLVVLHSALVHYSEANTSPQCRHAYSIHVIDGKEGTVYPKDNWLQRSPEMPFREVTSRVG